MTGTFDVKNNLNVVFGSNCSNCQFIVNNFDADNNATINVQGGGSISVTNDFSAGNGVNMTISEDSQVSVGGDFSIGGGTITVEGCSSGCSEDGQLIIGGTVSVPGGSIIGDGTVVITGDPNFTCPGGLNCIDGNGNPLPVKMAKFLAEQERNDVKLTWKTVSEINFNYFEVHKSSGKEFTQIGQVSSTGNVDGDIYTFVDRQPQTGLNFYQLKAVDFDGTYEWFPVTAALFTPTDKNLQFFPNPAINGSVQADFSDDFELDVYTVSGEMVLSAKVQNGDLSVLQLLQPGIYLFKYNINGLQKTQRMIIR